MARQRNWPLTILNIVTGAALVFFLYLALLWAPDAANLEGAERAAQRIFYVHMGNNAAAALAFLTTFIAGFAYLITRRKIWDTIGLSGVELGLVFATGTLITGSIWAKPTWNTYWTWDPRLTTSAIVWLLYVAYLMLRGAVENPEQRARFAAVYGILAFIGVPMTYFSIRWWRTIHPVVLGDASNADAQGGFALGPSIRLTMIAGMIVFSLLYVTLLIYRVRLEKVRDRIAARRQQLASS
jgi:heme exporter protein C